MAATGIIFSFWDTDEKYTSPDRLTTYTSSLDKSITALDSLAQLYRADKAGIKQLRQALADTRRDYKKSEFYLAFYFPEYNKEHFNGAPLLQIEKEGTRPKVIEPEGLQVLDELVFSDEAGEEKVKISAIVRRLRNSYTNFYNDRARKLPDAGTAAVAMRMQLIRIFSLGITGFDTPGSLNGLTEAAASLQGMEAVCNELYHDKPHFSETQLLFKGSIDYLGQHADFDTFNRLEFFKQYIDPLYKNLLTFQASVPNSLKNTSAWNAASNSIFSEDFLNPYFFSSLKGKEDTQALRELGKTLFYDNSLSGQGTMSCATCHKPEMAFTDGAPKSASSVQGKAVLRNAPTLLNAAYSDRYFYDLRAFTLEQQAEHVIFNPEEFNTAYSAILQKLKSNLQYTQHFEKVFGKQNPVTRENFSKALASYVISLKSYNSPADKFLRGETTEIAENVKRGFNLFMGKAACATCHFAPTFSGLVPPLYSENESEILGVLQQPDAPQKLDADNGRIDNGIYTEHAWIYEKSFKTVTVRNAADTAPYFHNGAYNTLEDIIDFYNEGGGEGMGLTVKNQTLAPDKLNLTAQEKTDLIAFIKALSDNPYKK